MDPKVIKMLSGAVSLSASLLLLGGCSFGEKDFAEVSARYEATASTALPEKELPEPTAAGVEVRLPDEDGYFEASAVELFWTETEGGVLLAGYIGDDAYVSIPAQVCGMDVKGISSNTFAGSTVKGVKVPEGVELIQAGAFSGTELEVVWLPSSATTLESNIFGGASDVSIFAPQGSAAELYATENGFNFSVSKSGN